MLSFAQQQPLNNSFSNNELTAATVRAEPTAAWLAWAHLSDNPEQLVEAIDAKLGSPILSSHARQTAQSAAQGYTSSDLAEQARCRAKIAYFLVNSFKART